MLKGSLEKNLQKAKSLVKKQEFEAAHQIYKEILCSFPRNTRVQAAAKKLESLRAVSKAQTASSSLSTKS